MFSSENEFRDYLYENHKDDLFSLITGIKEPPKYDDNEWTNINRVLQRITENKINTLIESLFDLCLLAKELTLIKSGDSTTRIDLFGNTSENGISIIELKKSKQTERQAFTELLGYSNHMCSIFPGATEANVTSILISPMESRIVRDAFVQELVFNRKNIIALIPKVVNGRISLQVYYPDESYYKWFENNILSDGSMSVVALSFPIIDGWIDSDINNGGVMPGYSKKALNTVSNAISHRLERENIHAIVYASQKWGEIARTFPFPNTIFVVGINPFSTYRTTVIDDVVSGASGEGRLHEIQHIYNQLDDDEREFWFDSLEANARGLLIRLAKEEFEKSFLVAGARVGIEYEISTPDWAGIKETMIESVFTHNLDTYTSGVIRELYQEYLLKIYKESFDNIYFVDDLPKFSYMASHHYLAIWEILKGIGLGQELSID
ncbi:hypothetical protein [Aeromonas hydrophila]|uniref:hypothetical protein n=1 Tax=Aeromonas hydrophila TaxID=644 RepID=UPI001A927374|nr:hypothetical protein [Aeromonas hydrophila]MBO0409205.1 hypothetical protein [Aeromonas hydrophila]